jgi:SAM-dependent methyltransferase
MAPDDTELEAAYQAVADDYAQRIYHELDHKPLDRELLERFAGRVRGNGRVYDLGCGPGHVTKFLHDRGVEITGIDLSRAMIGRALALNPGVRFRRGDMRALPDADDTIAGMVGFYSIVHFPPDTLLPIFTELARVLHPGAPLLLAFHIGHEAVHMDEWWGHQVSIDFHFFDPIEIMTTLEQAGFQIVERTERDPYPDVEYPSRRAYIRAER